MKPPVVTSVTVSLSVGDKEYAKGNSSFMNLQATIPDGAEINQENLAQLADSGLDMYATAWITLLTARFASSTINGDEFKGGLARFQRRLENVRRFINGQSEPVQG